MDEHDSQNQLLTTLAVLVAIVVIVGGVVLAVKKDTSSSHSAVAPTSRMNSSAVYKDGSYTATGSYTSPGGQENITIDITLRNNIVTGSTAASGAHDSEAEDFQLQFIEHYKEFVVGKNLNEINVSHVAGSSLTSQGFNDALSKIRSEAQA